MQIPPSPLWIPHFPSYRPKAAPTLSPRTCTQLSYLSSSVPSVPSVKWPGLSPAWKAERGTLRGLLGQRRQTPAAQPTTARDCVLPAPEFVSSHMLRRQWKTHSILHARTTWTYACIYPHATRNTYTPYTHAYAYHTPHNACMYTHTHTNHIHHTHTHMGLKLRVRQT